MIKYKIYQKSQVKLDQFRQPNVFNILKCRAHIRGEQGERSLFLLFWDLMGLFIVFWKEFPDWLILAKKFHFPSFKILTWALHKWHYLIHNAAHCETPMAAKEGPAGPPLNSISSSIDYILVEKLISKSTDQFCCSVLLKLASILLLSTVDGDVLYVWHVLVAPVQHWHASSHTWIAYTHLLWQPQLCLCRVLQVGEVAKIL